MQSTKKSNKRVYPLTIIKRLLFVIIISYLLICALLYLFQRKLEYVPGGVLKAPKDYGIYDISHETLISYDDVELSLWYGLPKNERKEIIVYFHGNAGNLGDRAEKLKIFSKYIDYGIAALSYRGYPGSGGSPSEDAFIKDAEWLIKFLESQNYKIENMIFYGESLGAAIAIRMADKYSAKALILEAPFLSATKVAQKTYWYVPVNLLMKDKYESYRYMANIKSPTLIFHGTKDAITPVTHSRELFSLLPKGDHKKIEVKGAGHLEFDEYFLIKEIVAFIAATN